MRNLISLPLYPRDQRHPPFFPFSPAIAASTASVRTVVKVCVLGRVSRRIQNAKPLWR